MFVDERVAPENLSELDYLEELERHLAWEPRGVTPFVSVSQNLLRVLRHTVRGKFSQFARARDWRVALIDLPKVTGSVRAVWETDLKVDLHGVISDEFQKDFRENVSRAFGEWIGKLLKHAGFE